MMVTSSRVIPLRAVRRSATRLEGGFRAFALLAERPFRIWFKSAPLQR
ncbi:MAG: hypothetical protein QOI66_4853, partial [Myxococcales bacterium]|nr:hypothetical protein [Myxococcales bacterium]